MGRPPISIDWDSFDKLCALHCTLKEIANFFDCSPDTIENKVKEYTLLTYGEQLTFSAYYSQKSSAGKISIRRKQYELAVGGNITMLIWLGKQWLEQTDKTDLTSGGAKLANGIEITVVHKAIHEPKREGEASSNSAL